MINLSLWNVFTTKQNWRGANTNKKKIRPILRWGSLKPYYPKHCLNGEQRNKYHQLKSFKCPKSNPRDSQILTESCSEIIHEFIYYDLSIKLLLPFFKGSRATKANFIDP